MSYSAAGLPAGGTIQWTVIASTPEPCLEIEAPATGSSVRVRALANKHSVAIGDQTLQCTRTLGLSQTVLQLQITAAHPVLADVASAGTTEYDAATLWRVMQYQLVDLFGRDLRETYSYTNRSGQTVTVRVVDLLVSEQLLPISKNPSEGVPDPEAVTNVGVSDAGGFSDTHSLPRNVEWEVKQWLQIHIGSWTPNNQGFGNVVRILRIKSGIQPDPIKIRVYQDPNGPEIPEE